MIDNAKIKAYDGKDQIIFSDSFNIYENELVVTDIAGFSFKFIFEDSDPQEGQPDISAKPGNVNNEVLVTLSRKFRNTLGSSTSIKLPVLKRQDGDELLLSLYGKEISSTKFLHVTINFYLRESQKHV